jgi:hypothetical protein
MAALGKRLVNGIVSLVISVGVTLRMADGGDGPWEPRDVALAVGLSGFFSSYVTK